MTEISASQFRQQIQSGEIVVKKNGRLATTNDSGLTNIPTKGVTSAKKINARNR